MGISENARHGHGDPRGHIPPPATEEKEHDKEEDSGGLLLTESHSSALTTLLPDKPHPVLLPAGTQTLPAPGSRARAAAARENLQAKKTLKHVSGRGKHQHRQRETPAESARPGLSGVSELAGILARCSSPCTQHSAPGAPAALQHSEGGERTPGNTELPGFQPGSGDADVRRGCSEDVLPTAPLCRLQHQLLDINRMPSHGLSQCVSAAGQSCGMPAAPGEHGTALAHRAPG